MTKQDNSLDHKDHIPDVGKKVDNSAEYLAGGLLDGLDMIEGVRLSGRQRRWVKALCNEIFTQHTADLTKQLEEKDARIKKLEDAFKLIRANMSFKDSNLCMSTDEILAIIKQALAETGGE